MGIFGSGLSIKSSGFRLIRLMDKDDINPGVPLKGSIRVPLRGSHKGIDRVLGFRVMISILHYLKDPRLWEFW